MCIKRLPLALRISCDGGPPYFSFWRLPPALVLIYLIRLVPWNKTMQKPIAPKENRYGSDEGGLSFYVVKPILLMVDMLDQINLRSYFGEAGFIPI